MIRGFTVRFPAEARDFVLARPSDTPRPGQPYFQLVPSALSPGVKRPKRDTYLHLMRRSRTHTLRWSILVSAHLSLAYLQICAWYTKWRESTSELHRPSDRRLSARLVPTVSKRGCRVARAADPYGRILGF
jgi:hypothetical protein